MWVAQNGQIVPSGKVGVYATNDKTFSIIPNSNFQISDVLVDGASVIGDVNFIENNGIFTFENISSDHTIVAKFEFDKNLSESQCDKNILLYPNPVSDKIFIYSTENILGVDVYNLYGLSVSSDNYNSNDVTIDSENFETGIYLMKIQTQDGLKTCKVIKK